MVSFIVIGRNESWRLEKCFKSILNLVNQDNILSWELIYVDSKSSDNSCSIAKQYEAKTFLVEGYCNAAISRNIGAKEAKGEILFFIDGDMEIVPGFLPQVLINNQSELVYPFVSGIFNDVIYDRDWKYMYTSRRHNLNEGDNDIYQSTTGGLFLIENVWWNRLNGMDTRFDGNEDYDFGLRMNKTGYPLLRKSVLLANHNTLENKMQNIKISSGKYVALMFRKHIVDLPYIKVFVMSQYTTCMMLLSVVCSLFAFHWSWVLYLLLLLYKIRKRNVNLLWKTPLRDMLILMSIIFYYPKKRKLQYVKL